MEHAFTCDVCGAEAGRLTTYAPGEALSLRGMDWGERPSDHVFRTSTDRARLAMTSGLGDIVFYEFDRPATEAAMGRGDAKALYAIDPEMVPFWCGACRLSYCADHWRTWNLFDEGFFDELRGRCPKGHERLLID